MYGIVVHGGAGGTSSQTERGCQHAAQLGMDILRKGGAALDAAVAAVQYMEDSGIFNAGSGAVLRFDGDTIEMDAVVATSTKLQGAVSGVRNVKNPVLLARAVLSTPHLHLTGVGATDFARRIGLEPHPGPTKRVLRRFMTMKKGIEAGRLIPPGWTPQELEALWESSDEIHSDTVGAVALDKEGIFAVAASTGGSGLMLPGRVGDVPERGAGYEVSQVAGVLATGIGEEIIRQQGAGKVHRLIELGLGPQDACGEVGRNLFSHNTPVGFIALTKEAVGIAANCEMASYSIAEQ